VLGRWEFFGLDFVVTPDVLIPRPETELLVEQALEWWRNSKSEIRNALLCRNPKSEIRNALDVGTGSGCIAIALAVHVPELHITATDISSAALVVARANAQKHGVADRIQFLQADLLNVPRSTCHVERCDLIVANLPYIPTGTLKTLEVYGKEPSLALDGGPDGLAFIRRLLQDAPGHLTPGGRVLLEIEASQGEAVRTLGRTIFPDAEVDILPDLAGHDRVLRIQLKTAH
jgi:release factor glutamine methyltransferase